MSLYIQGLRADDERRAAEAAARAEADSLVAAAAARDRLRPLGDRLSELLATIPAEVKREGLSLEALRPLLRGRRGRGCSSAELGQALRRAGWTRKRGWGAGVGDGFGASWFPK